MGRGPESQGRGLPCLPQKPDLCLARNKKTGAHSPEFAPVFSSPFLRESLAAHLPLAGRLKRKNLHASHGGPASLKSACCSTNKPGPGLHTQSALRGGLLQLKKQARRLPTGFLQSYVRRLCFSLLRSDRRSSWRRFAWYTAQLPSRSIVGGIYFQCSSECVKHRGTLLRSFLIRVRDKTDVSIAAVPPSFLHLANAQVESPDQPEARHVQDCSAGSGSYYCCWMCLLGAPSKSAASFWG